MNFERRLHDLMATTTRLLLTLSIEDGRIVGAVDLPVVLLREFTESHEAHDDDDDAGLNDDGEGVRN